MEALVGQLPLLLGDDLAIKSLKRPQVKEQEEAAVGQVGHRVLCQQQLSQVLQWLQLGQLM